jgi:ribonuclease D
VSHTPRWIADTKSLRAAADVLMSKSAISFDTEFDSFNRTYGFTLHLIQVYDGETVYLIDPLAVKDLRPLWEVMENEHIEKVGYALGEDVRLMKVHGCNSRNLCDIQIARRLSNRTEAGLARSLEEDLGIILDKASQTSDWSKRPLSNEQLEYLANDVIHLLKLRDDNSGYRASEELTSIYHEEMKMLEEVEVVERVVQLSRAQVKRFGPECQERLLEMLQWRDRIAQDLNVPTNYVVQAEQLENILENHHAFLQNPFARGFHPRVKGNERYRNALLDIVKRVPDDCSPVKFVSTLTREERTALLEQRLDQEEKIMRDVFLPLEAELLSRHGEEVVKFLLRGIRKIIVLPDPDMEALRPYQRRLVEGYMV